MKKSILTLCLVSFIPWSGCEQPIADVAESSHTASIQASVVTAAPDGFQESDDPDERYEAFKVRAAMRSAVRAAIGSAETWEEARDAANRAVAEHPDAPAFEKEQYVALLMLQAHLLPGSADGDAERLDAIGTYTDALVRHRNPSADVVDRALADLDGHWPPTRTAETARAAYDAAERYVEIKADCKGCGLDAIRASASRVRGNDATLFALQGALDGAEALRARF